MKAIAHQRLFYLFILCEVKTAFQTAFLTAFQTGLGVALISEGHKMCENKLPSVV